MTQRGSPSSLSDSVPALQAASGLGSRVPSQHALDTLAQQQELARSVGARDGYGRSRTAHPNPGDRPGEQAGLHVRLRQRDQRAAMADQGAPGGNRHRPRRRGNWLRRSRCRRDRPRSRSPHPAPDSAPYATRSPAPSPAPRLWTVPLLLGAAPTGDCTTAQTPFHADVRLRSAADLLPRPVTAAQPTEALRLLLDERTRRPWHSGGSPCPPWRRCSTPAPERPAGDAALARSVTARHGWRSQLGQTDVRSASGP